jgi:hypothetical protein
LQPYRPTRNASRVDIPIGTLLWRLDQLWNADKHRTPTLALSVLQESRLVINSPTLIPIEENLGTFGGRHVVFQLRSNVKEEREVQVKVQLSLDVGLGEGPAPGDRLDLTITDLYECVRYDVLPLFAPFF